MQRSLYLALTAGLCALPSVAFAQYTEVEPNESKATATAIASMASTQTLSGSTTGTSTTTAGAASADYWKIQTATAAPGIYRHVLTLNNTAFTSRINGLTVTSAAADTSAGAAWDGVIGTATATESTIQTGTTISGSKINVWYGFGKGEQVSWRVTGTTTTTAGYVGTLTSTPVTPTNIGTFTQGRVVIDARNQGHTTDTDFWVYDGDFNAIRGAGSDDTGTSSGDGISATASQGYLARDLTPGTYYVAMTNYNFVNNQPSPSDDNFRTGSVMDFANVAVNTSSTTAVNVAFRVSDSAGASQTVAATKANAFDIVWYSFTVQAPTLPTNPSVAATSFTPSFGIPGSTVAMAVTVSPGLNPTSSGIGVSVNAASVGGGTLTFLDDGVAPDVAAGDNIFSGTVAIAPSTVPGSLALPITITDAQSRTGSGSASLTVRPAPAANDDCANATVIASVPYNSPAAYIAGNVAAAATNCGSSSGYDVWYSYTPTISGTHRMVTDIGVATGNNVSDTVVSVFDACGGTRLACDDDSGAGFQSLLDFYLTAGTMYYIQVAKWGTGAPASGDTLGLFMDVLSTPPTATVTLSPNSGYEGTSFNIFMNVTPGSQPASTGLSARVDLTNVGGSTVSLADDGVAPDVAAGDNIFSGSASVAVGTALGNRALGWTIADDQGRTSTGNANFQVLAIPTGACCLGSSCQVLTQAACATAGGSYLGDNATCFSAGSYSTGASGGGAFEDISATGTALTQGDDTSVNTAIGFNFEFYGTVYTSLNVCSNGFIQFNGTSTAFTNTAIPAAGVPNNAIYPLWNDYDFTAGGQCYVQTLGTAGVDQRMIVQWNAVPRYLQADANTFQAVLFENGSIEFRYNAISPVADVGPGGTADATIGIENGDGTVATSFPASTALSAASFRIDYIPGSPNCGPSCSWAGDGCFADYDNNGGIDGDDVIAFFGDWDSAGECADVDGSGGVDGDDVISFFGAWDAGGVGFSGCE